MEKKKPNKGGSGCGGGDDDHLAIVKSAAWAWYQHGSGSEGNTMYEIDATRTRDQAPRPSRYKLEAMRSMKEEHHHQRSMEDSSQTTPSPIRTETSLLDDYEIKGISKQLDDLIASSNKRFYGLKIFDNDHILRRSMSLRSDEQDHSTCSPTKKKREKKKKFFGGIWERNSVVCGTREDVDTRAIVRRSGSGGHQKGMSW